MPEKEKGLQEKVINTWIEMISRFIEEYRRTGEIRESSQRRAAGP